MKFWGMSDSVTLGLVFPIDVKAYSSGLWIFLPKIRIVFEFTPHVEADFPAFA